MKVGRNTTISPSIHFYNSENIVIGENVRIDDFCIITGNVKIGNHLHIGAGAHLHGGGGILIEDFVHISPRVTIFSENDDWSGMSLIGPAVPMKYKPGYDSQPVVLRKHSGVCIRSTLLPGVHLETGAIVAAHSFVKDSCSEWSFYAGVPAKFLKVRPTREVTEKLEKQFLEEYNRNNP